MVSRVASLEMVILKKYYDKIPRLKGDFEALRRFLSPNLLLIDDFFFFFFFFFYWLDPVR